MWNTFAQVATPTGDFLRHTIQINCRLLALTSFPSAFPENIFVFPISFLKNYFKMWMKNCERMCGSERERVCVMHVSQTGTKCVCSCVQWPTQLEWQTRKLSSFVAGVICNLSYVSTSFVAFFSPLPRHLAKVLQSTVWLTFTLTIPSATSGWPHMRGRMLTCHCGRGKWVVGEGSPGMSQRTA